LFRWSCKICKAFQYNILLSKSVSVNMHTTNVWWKNKVIIDTVYNIIYPQTNNHKPLIKKSKPSSNIHITIFIFTFFLLFIYLYLNILLLQFKILLFVVYKTLVKVQKRYKLWIIQFIFAFVSFLHNKYRLGTYVTKKNHILKELFYIIHVECKPLYRYC